MYNKLLKRGGAALAFGALSAAKLVPKQKWTSLAPSIKHAASENYDTILNLRNRAVLESSLDVAISHKSCTLAPLFIKNISEDLIVTIGDAFSPLWPPVPEGKKLTGYEGGLAVLAIAFCRNMDRAKDVSKYLKKDGCKMYRMSRLADIMIDEGIPSRTRKDLKIFIKQKNTNGQIN